MVALTPTLGNNSQIQQVVVSQQQTIVALQSQIENIQSEVVTINSGLKGIGNQIRNDSLLEQSNLLEEQRREKSLAERQVRLGKENEVEEKINASLAKPIQALEPRLNSLFNGISNSLRTLLFGFLGSGVLRSISGISRFAITGLTNVKSFFTKSIGFVANTISSFKKGFNNVIGSIGNIIKKVTDIAINLAKSPIKFIADLFKSIPVLFSGGASAASNVASSGGSILDDLLKMGGRALSSGVGGIVSAGVDIASGENPNRAIVGGVGAAAGGALGGGLGSFLGPVGTLAGGITGSIVGQQGAKNLYDYSKMTFNPQTFSSNFSTNLNINPGQFFNGLVEGTKGLMSGAGISQMMNGETKNNEKIESSKAQISLPVEPKTPEIQIPTSSSPDQTLTPTNSPSQISPPPKQEIPLGSLPEPKPDVIVASTMEKNKPNMQSVSQSRSLTDVPLISSSNTDNFYTLYSQTHYNVVM